MPGQTKYQYGFAEIFSFLTVKTCTHLLSNKALTHKETTSSFDLFYIHAQFIGGGEKNSFIACY